jgi:phosphopantothenoylcysteine synthetase/decarboxylase
VIIHSASLDTIIIDDLSNVKSNQDDEEDEDADDEDDDEADEDDNLKVIFPLLEAADEDLTITFFKSLLLLLFS